MAFRFGQRRVTDPLAQQNFEQLEGDLDQISADLAVGRLIDVQTIRGLSESYSGGIPNPYLLDRGVAGEYMQLTYTPPVDCWWEVEGNNGIVNNQAAVWAYIYGYLQISPADEDGVTVASRQIAENHPSANAFTFRNPSWTFKLAAGVEYTVGMYLGGQNAGTWVYYRGADQLNMQAKAYTR